MSMTSKESSKFTKRNDDHSNPNHEHCYEDPDGYGEDLFGGCSQDAEREVWIRPYGSARVSEGIRDRSREGEEGESA